MADITFTYSGNPASSNKDAVRFLIGDTDSTDPLVQDEEINFLLTAQPNVKLAAADAAETIAAEFARKADRSLGDYSEKFSQISEQFFKLAEKLRKQATGSATPIPLAVPFAGGISIADKEAREDDADRVEPSIRKGMHDFDRQPPERDVFDP